MRLRLFVFLSMLMGLLVPTLAQEVFNSELMVTVLAEPSVDSSTGTISTKFIVEDDGIPIVDLNPDAVALDEATANVTLNTAFERQLHLRIGVDLSFGSDADLVQDSLRAFFDSYYLAQDDITVYILDAQADNSSDFRVVEIDSLETATEMISSLERAEQLFQTEAMIAAIFESLDQIDDTPFNSRQMLFVGSFLNRPSDAETASLFATEGIAVHGVQAHRTREEFTRVYRGLTNEGGGLFANNYQGIFVLPGDRYQPINNLKILYDTIGNSRIVYTLTWQTRNPSLESERTVDLLLELPSGASVVEPVTYTFEFMPAEITFINQASFDVTRQITRGDDGNLELALDERLVPVAVSFPDGVNRTISSLRLEIVDRASSEILQSDLMIDPQSVRGEYVLTWDLTDYTTPDSMIDVELVVTVTDELGIVSQAQTLGSVTLPSPPPTPTPIPTSTPIPSPTPLVSETSGGFTAGGLFEGTPVSNPLVGLLTLIIVLLLVALLLALVRMNRLQGETQPSASPVAVHEDDPATQPPEAPIDTGGNGSGAEPSKRYAQLVALDETENMIQQGILWVDQLEMVIGRGEACDHVIASPILNEQHCVITVKTVQDNVTVFIRDLNTINGTFINGNRIGGAEEYQLPMRTEFSLTKQLKFKLLPADANIEEVDRLSTIAKSTVYSKAEQLTFQSYQDLSYTPDEGPPVDEDYSPI